MIRFGIVGCGSVAQRYHLPALSEIPNVRLAALADVNSDTLSRVRARWPVEQAESDYRALRDIDAVLIAGPHALHAAMCETFLSRDVHVLVEKPMATTVAEAAPLLALADERRLAFAVGVFRRYYPSSMLVRALIDLNWQGGVREIDAEEGSVYDWELQSRFLLDRALAGGGVLMDTGSHLLDRLLWWFPGAAFDLHEYCDDSDGGIEADCELRFSLRWRDSVIACRAAMSRIRTLRNTIRLRTSEGHLELGANAPNGIRWGLDSRSDSDMAKASLWMQVGAPTADEPGPVYYFKRQLDDFVHAIETGSAPLNAASGNLAAVQLVENCYAARQPLVEPWQDGASESGLSEGLAP